MGQPQAPKTIWFGNIKRKMNDQKIIKTKIKHTNRNPKNFQLRSLQLEEKTGELIYVMREVEGKTTIKRYLSKAWDISKEMVVLLPKNSNDVRSSASILRSSKLLKYFNP